MLARSWPAVSRRASLESGATRETGPGAACWWCDEPIPRRSANGRLTTAYAKYCGKLHRQASWRFGWRRADQVASAGDTRRFAYADPPYPGKAFYYVEDREVPHASLVDRLVRGWPDGWALSTSAEALRHVLAVCPSSVRVAVWRRRTRQDKRQRHPINAWEPLIVYGGRPQPRGRQALDVLDYRGRYNAFPGALVGMKPPEFTVWMAQLLAARVGDRLDDLYPGSGAVSLAWDRYAAPVPSLSAVAAGDASLVDHDVRDPRDGWQQPSLLEPKAVAA